MSRSFVSRSSRLDTGFWLTLITAPPPGASSSVMTTWLGFVWTSAAAEGSGCGSAMSRPFCASGVTTMKMMSSTSMTSMSGVMLMSDMAPELAGRVASCECTTLLWRLGAFSALGFLSAIALAPLDLGFGDQRDLLDAGLAAEVHHLHH